MSEIVAAYGLAIVMALVLVLSVHIQNLLSAQFKIVRGKQPPGVPAEGNYGDKTFRVYRTHMNSVENLSMFIAALVFAILAGVNPVLVNWLAVIHVAARTAYWGVYYAGIGINAPGLRTICFVIGFFSSIALTIAALVSVIWS